MSPDVGRDIWFVVFDLEKVSECKSGDWMDGLIEELREKTEH